MSYMRQQVLFLFITALFITCQTYVLYAAASPIFIHYCSVYYLPNVCIICGGKSYFYSILLCSLHAVKYTSYRRRQILFLFITALFITCKTLPKRPIHFAKQFLKYYYQKKGVVENYFYFLTVSEEEIENLLNGLTASKATGLDSLPAWFLKDGAEVIACPLAHIINLSLHSSQNPEDMKNARVVPLYKKTK